MGRFGAHILLEEVRLFLVLIEEHVGAEVVCRDEVHLQINSTSLSLVVVTNSSTGIIVSLSLLDKLLVNNLRCQINPVLFQNMTFFAGKVPRLNIGFVVEYGVWYVREPASWSRSFLQPEVVEKPFTL